MIAAEISISRDDARALSDAKRNLDWLAMVEREAKSRKLPVLCVQAREEARAQKALFWLVAARCGLSTCKLDEIYTAARRAESGA